jgi:hypothetical protein
MSDPILNTVHLVALDESNKPGGGIGSGCLLRIDGRLVMLGVRHVTNNSKRWGLQIKYTQNRGMMIFQIGAPTYFTRFTFGDESITDLDFFVLPIELPELPRHQKWEAIDVCSRDEPVRIFELSDLVDPNEHDNYEFAGLVQPCLINGPVTFYEMVLTEESEMKFDADEKERFRFSLSHPHPGHDSYRGTSGAPITNQDGKLAALVMSGCECTASVFGFPIRRHLPVILATLAAEAL